TEGYKLIPSDGIYAVEVLINKESKNKNQEISNPFLTDNTERKVAIYKGMAYIGHRPTINGMSQNIEVNIFDFKEDIYHRHIQLVFHSFIREDIKFENLDQLIAQLGKDKQDVLKRLSK
ncbi:riboflavin biosynthesis protein RibF, partial [Pseudoxanthomonas sp. SGD-10]